MAKFNLRLENLTFCLISAPQSKVDNYILQFTTSISLLINSFREFL